MNISAKTMIPMNFLSQNGWTMTMSARVMGHSLHICRIVHVCGCTHLLKSAAAKTSRKF